MTLIGTVEQRLEVPQSPPELSPRDGMDKFIVSFVIASGRNGTGFGGCGLDSTKLHHSEALCGPC